MEKLKHNNVVLVPVDFTEASDCAINHAISIAKAGGHEISLVHVLDATSKDKLKKEGKIAADIEEQLLDECERIATADGLKCSYNLVEGSIFKDIEETGKQLGSVWQVMGTHGVVGLEQKLLGSFAIKVITSSHCPTIVTQKKHISPHGYKKIIFPVEAAAESKHKLWPTIKMAVQFNAEVLIYSRTETDEYLQNHVKLNVFHAERHFKENGIACSSTAFDPNDGSFADQLIKFTALHEADLVVIVTTSGKSVTEFIIGKEEEKIINNDLQVPVMCVNPVAGIFSITEATVY